MILLIDNYDSFTWNLFDYLSQAGKNVQVVRNDAITIAQAASMQPEAIVLSPGPGTPPDAGITMDVIAHFHHRLPILGICLGYQALGMYFGAELVHSPVPVHGKTSTIRHNGSGLFKDIPNPTTVMRYHSLNIRTWPDCLECTAFTATDEPMALQHRSLPLAGVQYHPESILTPYGLPMLRNWVASLQAVK